LVSGGLDSALAVKLMLEQGIKVEAIHFSHLFCPCPRCSHKKLTLTGREKKDVFKELDIEPKVVDISQDLIELIKKPKHGFGANMNPCIDCRILMLKKAKEYMDKAGASFIVTGEVVGQRPMSQQKNTLNLIDKEAGLAGLILRPLSAKVMPETLAEKNGWVDREKLLDITGRTRKAQEELAKEYNIKDYPCAAGGCLLTESEFCKRIKDLIKFGKFFIAEATLLTIGRHFRFSEHTKLVVGRDERENEQLFKFKQEGDCTFFPKETNGPAGLLRGRVTEDYIAKSAGIIARYCDRLGAERVKILFSSDKASQELCVEPMPEEKIEAIRI